MTEAQLQAAVIEAAQLFGWKVHHVRPARTPDGKFLTRIQGDRGFPDLVLCRSPEILFVELKSESGKIRAEQADWLDVLDRSGGVVRVWRPNHWRDGTIMDQLKAKVTR